MCCALDLLRAIDHFLGAAFYLWAYVPSNPSSPCASWPTRMSQLAFLGGRKAHRSCAQAKIHVYTQTHAKLHGGMATRPFARQQARASIPPTKLNHAPTSTHALTQTHSHTHTQTHAHTHKRANARTRTCTRTYADARNHARTRGCSHTDADTYTATHTDTPRH